MKTNEEIWEEIKAHFPFHFIQNTYRREEFDPVAIEKMISGCCARVPLSNFRTAWGFETQEALDAFKAATGAEEAKP